MKFIGAFIQINTKSFETSSNEEEEDSDGVMMMMLKTYEFNLYPCYHFALLALLTRTLVHART